MIHNVNYLCYRMKGGLSRDEAWLLTRKEEEELFEFEQQELITENEELNHYRNRYEEVQQQFHSVKYDLEKIIDKTTYVKSSCGGGYLKLDLSKDEFENIKQKL